MDTQARSSDEGRQVDTRGDYERVIMSAWHSVAFAFTPCLRTITRTDEKTASKAWQCNTQQMQQRGGTLAPSWGLYPAHSTYKPNLPLCLTVCVAGVACDLLNQSYLCDDSLIPVGRDFSGTRSRLGGRSQQVLVNRLSPAASCTCVCPCWSSAAQHHTCHCTGRALDDCCLFAIPCVWLDRCCQVAAAAPRSSAPGAKAQSVEALPPAAHSERPAGGLSGVSTVATSSFVTYCLLGPTRNTRAASQP
jgi:hypothetical protein